MGDVRKERSETLRATSFGWNALSFKLCRSSPPSKPFVTILVLPRFQWVGVVLTTDGRRYDAFYVWVQSHLCPSVKSVVKTGFSFDIITP
jgi:hypothetical protein